MSGVIEKLEDRVRRAAARIRELDEERSRLATELDQLREHVTRLERRPVSGAPDLVAQRAAILDEMRATLEDLRAE